jgi:hypothetical protein
MLDFTLEKAAWPSLGQRQGRISCRCKSGMKDGRILAMSEANAFGGYIVTRPEIAHGGSGLVHEGSAPDGKRRVAIKVLDKELIERNIQRALARKHPSLGNRPLEITQ